MVILIVDTEHARVVGHPRLGPAHGAKIAATADRLASLSEVPCRAIAYDAVDLATVVRIAPSALIIGGNTTDWDRFDPAALEGLLTTIRAAPLPILGICAGHQLIGRAHGAAWGPLGPLRPCETDPDPRFAPGRRKERGFLDVALDPHCPLFAGLDRQAAFFQSHSWQLTEVPPGFVARASSPWSAIQALERRDAPVYGVQFHPERHDPAHPAGAAVLRNFFARARTWAAGHR